MLQPIRQPAGIGISVGRIYSAPRLTVFLPCTMRSAVVDFLPAAVFFGRQEAGRPSPGHPATRRGRGPCWSGSR